MKRTVLFLLAILFFSWTVLAQDAQILSVRSGGIVSPSSNPLFSIFPNEFAIVTVSQFTVGQQNLPPVNVSFALMCKDFLVANSCTADWCNALRTAPYCVPSAAPNGRTKVRCLPYVVDLQVRNKATGALLNTQRVVVSQSIKNQVAGSSADNCGEYQMQLQLPQISYSPIEYIARVKLVGKWNSQFTTAQVEQPIDDGSGYFRVNPSCTEGARYCDAGNEIRVCQNGAYVTNTVCSAPNYAGCAMGSTACTSANGTSNPILNGACFLNEVNLVKCDVSSLKRTVKCIKTSGLQTPRWEVNQACVAAGCSIGNSACNQGPVCGNGTCESGESSSNCIADCGPPQGGCNGVCGPEDNVSCPSDCAAPPGPVCGNGQCEAGEDTSNCVPDCGTGVQTCQAAQEGEWTALGCRNGKTLENKTTTTYEGVNCTPVQNVQERENPGIPCTDQNQNCTIIKDWEKIGCFEGFTKMAQTISCAGVEQTITKTDSSIACESAGDPQNGGAEGELQQGGSTGGGTTQTPGATGGNVLDWLIGFLSFIIHSIASLFGL